MLKRLTGLLVLLALATAPMLYAGNPTIIAYQDSVDTVTVDSTYGSTWKIIDSVIIAADDSANVSLSVTGTVYMAPHDRLYIGWSDSLGGAAKLDTLAYYSGIMEQDPKYRTFTLQDVKTYTAATTDTLYIYACTGSSTTPCKLSNVTWQAIIGYHEKHF